MSAIVTSWTPVGGVFKHVEYKIEVNLDGSTWDIYRRYASFVALDRGIRSILGESFVERGNYNPKLPSKELPHYLNPSAVHSRLTGLNQYLQEVISFVPPEKHKDTIRNRLREFLDTENRGKSGIRISLDARNNPQES